MKSEAQILENPALLKMELMLRGIRIDPGFRDQLDAEGFGVTGHALFGSADDIDLVLPGGTWTSTPVIRGLLRSTPYTLMHDELGDLIQVGQEGRNVRVEVRPTSQFFRHTTSTGIPFGRIGTVHGPYLALSPSNHCSFLDSVERCRFCGVGQEAATHDPVPVDDILKAIQLARSEHPVAMVYLSVGHLGSADGGVRFLEPYVEAIKKHFDILVAVDALPPKDNGWIDRTYGMGVDAVSYNLEIFDPERFKTICPGPARVVGRERFLDALSYAATVFPSGGVTCHLVVGLESIESTHRGIDELTSIGVLPVLPIYRPFKGRDMRQDEDVSLFAPTQEELISLNTHLYRTVRKQKINLNLVRDIAIVTTPSDGRFISPDDGFWTRFHQRIMGTRMGRRISAHLSDLRRALRVRKVEEASCGH